MQSLDCGAKILQIAVLATPNARAMPNRRPFFDLSQWLTSS